MIDPNLLTVLGLIIGAGWILNEIQNYYDNKAERQRERERLQIVIAKIKEGSPVIDKIFEASLKPSAKATEEK